MTYDKAGHVQSALSAGGTKRDAENALNVPAGTVTWPDGLGTSEDDDDDGDEMFATAASRAATAPSTHRPQKLPEPEYARATFSCTTVSTIATIAININCNINTTTIMVTNTTNTIWQFQLPDKFSTKALFPCHFLIQRYPFKYQSINCYTTFSYIIKDTKVLNSYSQWLLATNACGLTCGFWGKYK